MAKSMSKSQTIAHIADKNKLPKKSVAQILETLTALAYKEAKNSFTLPGSANWFWSTARRAWAATPRQARRSRSRPNGS